MLFDLIIVVINITILYYLNALEKKHCMCIRDYRHNLLKISSIILIICAISISYINNTSNIYRIISIIYQLVFIINFFTMFTYIRDLNKTKCNCALHDVRYTNNFLYYYRYIVVFVILLYFIATIYIIRNIKPADLFKVISQ